MVRRHHSHRNRTDELLVPLDLLVGNQKATRSADTIEWRIARNCQSTLIPRLVYPYCGCLLLAHLPLVFLSLFTRRHNVMTITVSFGS